MNAETLIAVFGYGPSVGGPEAWYYNPEGDVDKIRMFLPYYEHHGCPVVIMSPADAPILSVGRHLCYQAGRRGYIGQESLDRQRDHLRILLGFPHKYFLLNDSDSLCLSPELPKYLYEDAAIVWSNEVVESRPHESPLPKIAMQPPYFLGRQAIVKMLDVSDRIRAHPITPYIDHYMLQLTCEAGLRHQSFETKEVPPGKISTDTYTDMEEKISKNGRVMLHPVKTVESLIRWKRAYDNRK